MTGKDGRRETPLNRGTEGLLVFLILLVPTLVVYWQVGSHPLLVFRDDARILMHPHVQAGLTLEGIRWAFSTTHEGNWLPLTRLSHMLGCQFFGMNPGWHHLSSLFFHLVNTLLLFFLLMRMTGALWRSGIVAALFALHPLQVESVAWVAQREELVKALFCLLTLWAYVRYGERPSLNRYLLCLAVFALGLSAGPVLAALPFVLMLMDHWPLGRLPLGQSTNGSPAGEKKASVYSLAWEKAPFFALAAAFIVVTHFVLRQGEGVTSLRPSPWNVSLGSALLSCLTYMGKMIWPYPLALFYPPPHSVPVWEAAGAASFLAGISILAVWTSRKAPYMALGWLWYLLTFFSAAGLAQGAGWPAMSDRLTYLPLIGLFLIIVWGVADVFERVPSGKVVRFLLGSAVISALMVTTWLQLRHWQSNVALFTHAVKTSPESAPAHNYLAFALARKGSYQEAIRHLSEALRINPDDEEAHSHLGLVLDQQGRFQEAIGHFSEALRANPDHAEAHSRWGLALMRKGLFIEAINHYREALRINPDDAGVHNNLGAALYEQGRFEEALGHFSEALRIRPDYKDARKNLLLVERLMGVPSLSSDSP